MLVEKTHLRIAAPGLAESIWMGRLTTMKLAVGLVAVFFLASTQADALTLKPKTKAGVTCPVMTIAQPNSYGILIPDCGVPVAQVNAAGYLFRDPTSGSSSGGTTLPIPDLPPILPILPPLEIPPITLPIDLGLGAVLGDGSKLAGASRFPPGNSLPYQFVAPTSKVGNSARITFTLQLRSKKRNPQKWRKKSIGKNCVVVGTRSPRDTLKCNVREPVG